MMIDRQFEKIVAFVGPDFSDFETQVVCVDIQNIHDAFFAKDNIHSSNPLVKNYYPNLAPPWPITWYEFARVDPTGHGEKIGIAACCLKYSLDRLVKQKRLMPTASVELTRWAIRFFVFIENRIVGFQCAFVADECISSDGKSLLGEDFIVHKSPMMKSFDKRQQDLTVLLLHESFLAVSFLHCKNIIIHPDDSKTKLDKKRAKKGRKPVFQFKTLNIKPLQNILQQSGGLRQHGLSKALHVCRGHFKDYRYGRGLFGKVKGVFWWDMHERGNESEGVVHKDYKLDV